MQATAAAQLQAVLILLLAAIVAVPLAQRIKVSPVLGYLAAGLIVGPYGFAFIEKTEEAERLAELLERGGTDHGAADRGLEFAQRHVPAQPLTQVFSVTPASKSDVLAVTSQLSGSQLCHSFLPGSGARLRNTRAG